MNDLCFAWALSPLFLVLSFSSFQPYFIQAGKILQIIFVCLLNTPRAIFAQIGQLAGGLLVFAGGFVALYRFLVQSESDLVSALAWLGLAATILTASTLVILQAVDGISLKRAVDSWANAPQAEKTVTFRVVEGIRWIEIGTASMFRILQAATGIIFGAAIAIKRGAFPRWVGGIGIFAGILLMYDGISVAYIGFDVSRLAAAYELTFAAWLVIVGIYMWKRTPTKTVTP